jgi:hypothetical protein
LEVSQMDRERGESTRIAIGSWGGCRVGIAAGLVAAWLMMACATPPAAPWMDRPGALEKPRIVVGAGLLTKGPFVESAGLGAITDIARGQFDGKPGLEIGIAGNVGAVFVDDSGQTQSSIVFDRQELTHVDIVDVEGDGVCEFIYRGAWGSDAALIDHSGETRWTYGGLPGVDDMCAGDVDGDGLLEFAVGFNGGGGVHLLDDKGKRIWRQPDGNVWHVEMVDTNADGRPEIVHSSAGGDVTVRDGKGNELSREEAPAYFSDFSLCPWPTKQGPMLLLCAEDDTVWILDFRAKTVAKFKAPDSGKLGEARGTPVRLKAGQADYLAVAVSYPVWHRAILYLYDPGGKLVYQEILPEACDSIAALALGGGDREVVLLGGQGKVWKYELTGPPQRDDGATA